MLFRHLLLFATLFIAAHAHALSAGEVKGIIFGETEARVEALSKAAVNADEKTAAFIQALSDDAVKASGDKVFVVKEGKAFDPLTGAEQPLPPDAEDVINPNLMRSEIDNALAALKLLSRDEKLRREAIKTLAGESDEARLPLIEKAYAAETVPQLKSQLELMRAAILLGSSDKARR
ncbi:MAG: urea ABC transporter permease subunit UrtB, partial [Polaromonas sp.]